MPEDIRVHAGLLDSPKLFRLVKRHPEALTGLLRLWLWAAHSKPDGILGEVAAEEVQFVCRIDSSEWLTDLIALGWVDVWGENGLRIHDWDEHQPWVVGAKSRSERARHAARMRHACPGHAQRNAESAKPHMPLSLPSPSLPILSSPAPTQQGAAKAARVSSDDIDEVVAHYRTLHPRAKGGDPDRKRIAARLKEGFTVPDLLAAIDGCHRSAHNCGENKLGRRYQSMELIFRNSTKVQQFMETPHDRLPHERVQRGAGVINNTLRILEERDRKGIQ